MDFSNKVVMLTGAKGAIGAATENQFLKAGATVISTDFTFPEKKYDSVDLKENPAKLYLDVTKSENVKELVKFIAEHFNTLDIVVNIAGILSTKAFTEITEAGWDQVMAVNLKGTFLVCQEALKYMMPQKNGCFVNISSVTGKHPGGMADASYAASKAGIIGLTKSMARACAPFHIRANTIAPGLIESAMVDHYCECFPDAIGRIQCGTPLGRFGKPVEIAKCILFLCSEDASYITGACLDINGGYIMD